MGHGGCKIAQINILFFFFSTYRINIAQGEVEHADRGGMADGHPEGDGCILGVVRAMEDVGKVQQGQVPVSAAGKTKEH